MSRERMSARAESSQKGLAALEVIVPARQCGRCHSRFVRHDYVQIDDCHIARNDSQRVRCEAVEHDALRLRAEN